MIVLDASAAVELLLGSAAGRRVADVTLVPGCDLHAPHLLDCEVASALRRGWLRGQLGRNRLRSALADLVELPARRHGHVLLLDRVWELRDVLTAYDAIYVALAEALDAPLLTCDARLARASGHGARVLLR